MIAISFCLVKKPITSSCQIKIPVNIEHKDGYELLVLYTIKGNFRIEQFEITLIC
jgi:hypothetical protein